jgi:hypothetical protein
MAGIAWVVLCESMFRDETDRLCLLGIADHLPVPSLPLVLVDHLVVAKLTHGSGPEALGVSFGVMTPGGCWVSPSSDATAVVSMSGNYLIVGLRTLPLREEGVHTFEVSLSSGATASVDIPVWLCSTQQPHAQLH